jgi:hypothetical protein
MYKNLLDLKSFHVLKYVKMCILTKLMLKYQGPFPPYGVPI